MKNPVNIQNLQLASGRAWVSSAALLSFLFLSAAPLNAQGGNPEGAIVGTSADLEDLLVTVAWPDPVADEWREIVVFDENDVQIAGQPVWPNSGEREQSIFDNFLHRLPASGFQFAATVRDAAGRDVSPRHAFRVVLECPPGTGPCQWRTQDGVHTNALAISEPLMTTLDALEARRSSDLLADALEERPDLRGSVLSLAAQLDRLDQELDLEDECFCAWYHSSKRDPSSQNCDGIGKTEDDEGSSGWESGWSRGVGARAAVAGQITNFSSPKLATVSGRSEQTLELRCWRILHRQEVTHHLPMLSPPGAPLRTIQFPTVEACADSCRGTVESLASIDFEFSAKAYEPGSDSVMDALSIADASLERDDGVNDPPKKNTWQDWLQWQSGHTNMEYEGSAQIPEDEAAKDDDIRRLTATLSVKATVDFEADGVDDWTYATASIKGTLLRLEGHATCALLPDREAELDAFYDSPKSDDCGELQIEPWVD